MQSEYTRLPSEMLDLKDLYKWIYEVSDDILILSASTEENDTESYVLIKEITIPEQIMLSNFRVTFDLRVYPGGITTANAIICKDGVPVSSTVHGNSTATWSGKTEDVGTFDEGDKLQIYGKVGSAGYKCQVRNLRIRGYIANQYVGVDVPTWS